MTVSPYDSLPVAKAGQADKNPPFQEVVPEPTETSDTMEVTTMAHGAPEEASHEPSMESTYDSAEETLQYVDVPVDAPCLHEEAPGLQQESIEEEVPHTPKALEATEHTNIPYPPSPEASPKSSISDTIAVPKSPMARKSGEDKSCELAKKTTALSPAPKYSAVTVDNMWKTGEFLLPFEETFLVPDTMSDMEALLFTDGRICNAQSGKLRYEKNDAVSGEITVYTVYKPSVSSVPIDVVKSTVSFKTDKCWESCSGDSFIAEISLRAISAEMLNERKFTVKGTISIDFTEIAHRELKIFQDSEDNDLVRLESSTEAAALISETSEATEIAQEINIHEDRPIPSKILRESYSIVETHRQITAGKLVINASIVSSILYLGQENGEAKLCNINNKTDFTQFIAMEKNADTELMHISFSGDSLKASVENQSRFMIRGHIDTNICCYENRKLPMVSDAYHKKCEITFDLSRQPLSAVAGTVSGEISAREVINIEESDKKPKTLLCGSFRPEKLSGFAENGRIVIDGRSSVKILALDEDDEPFVITAQVPLRGALEMSCSGDDLEISVSAALKEFWFDTINSRQLEINLGVHTEVWALIQENFSTIENIRSIQSSAPPKHIPMAIYVVGADDSLWDIAKRYKCDISHLAHLNDLESEDPLTEGTKLFVMK